MTLAAGNGHWYRMTSQPSAQQSPQHVAKPWYYSGSFVGLSLFLCSPLGLILMWAGKVFSGTARAIITVVFGVFFVAVAASKGEQGDRRPRSTVNTQAANAPALVLPREQAALSSAVQAAKAQYRAAPNELKKSAVRTQRKGAIEQALGGVLEFKDWRGTLTSMKTNSEGKAYVEIRSADKSFSVKTWNNMLSDVEDQTLIAQDSPLFAAIAELSEGAAVSFSGRFVEDPKDGIRESSMSEAGSMTDPEFIAKFSEIRGM